MPYSSPSSGKTCGTGWIRTVEPRSASWTLLRPSCVTRLQVLADRNRFGTLLQILGRVALPRNIVSSTSLAGTESTSSKPAITIEGQPNNLIEPTPKDGAVHEERYVIEIPTESR